MKHTPEAPPLVEREKPGLSQTLEHPRHPGICQACGAVEDLEKWEECDPWDKRQSPGVFIVLCGSCAKRLIDPHPRLYEQAGVFMPYPGIMQLCVDCRHRTELSCRSPLLKANGGPGLIISYPEPITAFLCGPRSPGLTRIYQGAPTKCEGRQEL